MPTSALTPGQKPVGRADVGIGPYGSAVPGFPRHFEHQQLKNAFR